MIGADNQKIGDVSDILFDKAGKIEAFVVSVGGFLGMGAKDVALAPASFQVVAGDKSKNEADKLRLSMTKDQLKQAANFEPYKEPRTTTGMGGTPAPLRRSPPRRRANTRTVTHWRLRMRVGHWPRSGSSRSGPMTFSVR